jgi:hypothetical protein
MSYVLIRKTLWNEFRVNLVRGLEATASYHTDLEDAIGTGRANWPQAEIRYRGKIVAVPKQELYPCP